MIQASDLRIGNYLYGLVKNEDFGEVAGRITFHIKSGRHIDTICKHINQKDLVEPIPLTPEILEKAGSKKGERIFLSEWFYVVWDGVDAVWFRCFNETEEGTQIACTEYVHQLQNLYYALTGKELEIKL